MWLPGYSGRPQGGPAEGPGPADQHAHHPGGPYLGPEARPPVPLLRVGPYGSRQGPRRLHGHQDPPGKTSVHVWGRGRRGEGVVEGVLGRGRVW